MKTQILHALCYFLAISLLISQTACSVLGYAIGSSVDKSRNKKDPSKVVIHEGWKQPDKRNTMVELELSNKKTFKGAYKKMDYYQSREEIVEQAVIKIDNKLYRLPVHSVESMKIFPNKSNKGKNTWMTVGLVLDLILVLTAIGFEKSVEESIKPIFECC